MSFVSRCSFEWARMAPAERLKLLDGLRAAMESRPDLWDWTPPEAMADTADYNSLPTDLQGHLIFALGERGLTVEEFVISFERAFGRKLS
ncbi:MAG: hypothetical protein Q8Q41_01415 [bacterium]|nr:hypothetical protein [bacterium]